MRNGNSDYFTEMVKLISGLGVVALVVVFVIRSIAGSFDTETTQDPAAVDARLKPVEVVNLVGGPAPAAVAKPAPKKEAEKPAAPAKAEEKAPEAAKAEPAKEAAPAAEAADAGGMGKMIYTKTCFACHGTGLLESPKKGDAAEWKKRLDANGGLAGLVKSGMVGKGAMPPKGGAANLTDEDMQAAIEYMMK